MSKQEGVTAEFEYLELDEETFLRIGLKKLKKKEAKKK